MKAIGFNRPLPVSDPDCLQDLDLPAPEPGPHDLLVVGQRPWRAKADGGPRGETEKCVNVEGRFHGRVVRAPPTRVVRSAPGTKPSMRRTLCLPLRRAGPRTCSRTTPTA